MRVFSCWVSSSVARVALSWEKATEGVVDPEVRVISSEADLFHNIAKAEKLLSEASTPPVKSVAERMAAARKAVGKVKSVGTGARSLSSKKHVAPAAAATVATPAVDSSTTGQSGGSRMGLSGVVRTKEAIQITNCFIHAKSAVKIEHVEEPCEIKIFGELPAPGDKTYIQQKALAIEEIRRVHGVL